MPPGYPHRSQLLSQRLGRGYDKLKIRFHLKMAGQPRKQRKAPSDGFFETGAKHIFRWENRKAGWIKVSIYSINEHLFVPFTMAHKTTNVFSLTHFTLHVTSFNQNEGN